MWCCIWYRNIEKCGIRYLFSFLNVCITDATVNPAIWGCICRPAFTKLWIWFITRLHRLVWLNSETYGEPTSCRLSFFPLYHWFWTHQLVNLLWVYSPLCFPHLCEDCICMKQCVWEYGMNPVSQWLPNWGPGTLKDTFIYGNLWKLSESQKLYSSN